MNEETRKYIENLRKKFESECNGPGDLKRRQELLANTRRATTICNKEFTKTETEYAAFEVGSSFDFGFYIGARWADEHPKSPWISVKDALPQAVFGTVSKVVMLSLADGTLSTGSLFDLNKKYWEVDIDEDFVEVNDEDYWMPIPELNKSENQ